MQHELALRGHRTIAVDLPGRGAGYSLAYHLQDLETFAAEPSPVARVTAAETIAHVADVVRQVRAHGPVILVGHSFGGLVVTGVANAIPDQLDRLVYISAQCPVERHPGEYLALPEWSDTDLLTATGAIMVGDPQALGVIRLNWRGADRAAVAALKKAIAADCTDEEVLRVIGSSQPDEFLWHADPEWDHRAERATWGTIPRTFVRLSDDRAMPPAAQDLYIKEADALTPENPFEVHTVASSHGGFFRHPHEVADILASYA
jgi:pimeloyl-ACP methyl ester carboxylesterase